MAIKDVDQRASRDSISSEKNLTGIVIKGSKNQDP